MPHLGKKEPKTDFIRARVDRTLKLKAERLLHRCGMTMTQAMNMVLNDLVENGHWPYIHREFNDETIADLEASKRGEGLVKFNTPEEFFADLHSEDEDKDK